MVGTAEAGFQFVTRDSADGSHEALGLYAWSRSKRRKPVRLRLNRGGDAYIPTDRGRRRADLVRDLAHLFEVSPTDPRGPLPGSDVPSNSIFETIERLRESGLSVEAACEVAREDFPWSASTIRDHYYAQRRSRSNDATRSARDRD